MKMIINLFSIFDPTSYFSIQLNWLRTTFFIVIIPTSFWLIPPQTLIVFNKITKHIHTEFLILINSTHKGSSIIFIRLFTIILINNFIGLYPYIFTSTSHLVTTLTISVPVWLSFIIFGWFKNYQLIFIHLVPQGTPSLLIPFIVCIETIRNIIRPITLAVRLSANIIAGHLLITLLGNTRNILTLTTIPALLIIQIALLTLECAVACIQAYVFSVLTVLYSREVI